MEYGIVIVGLVALGTTAIALGANSQPRAPRGAVVPTTVALRGRNVPVNLEPLLAPASLMEQQAIQAAHTALAWNVGPNHPVSTRYGSVNLTDETRASGDAPLHTIGDVDVWLVTVTGFHDLPPGNSPIPGVGGVELHGYTFYVNDKTAQVIKYVGVF